MNTGSDKEYPINPLPGYTFNINDFKTDQINILMMITQSFNGNQRFLTRLKHELIAQETEKSKFFAAVKKEREKRINNQLTRELMQKLYFPQSVLPKERKMTGDPGFSLVKWQPLGTFEEIVSRVYSEKECIAALLPGSTELTGWERLKRAFLPHFFVPNYCASEPAHYYNYDNFVSTTLAVGLAVGLIMGFPYGKRSFSDFEKVNSGNIYARKSDANRARVDSFLKGYLRYAYRWSWRFSFLVGGMYLISQGLSIYRLKESPSHYIIGSFIPFSLYKWYRGPKGMLSYGTMGCVLFGLPLSFFVCFLNCNPRTMYYSAAIQPIVSAENHWSKWTSEQQELNKYRYEAIFNEARKNITKTGEEVYDEFFPGFKTS